MFSLGKTHNTQFSNSGPDYLQRPKQSPGLLLPPLSDDCLIHSIGFLKLCDVVCLMGTCKSLKRIANHNVWRPLCQTNFPELLGLSTPLDSLAVDVQAVAWRQFCIHRFRGKVPFKMEIFESGLTDRATYTMSVFRGGVAIHYSDGKVQSMKVKTRLDIERVVTFDDDGEVLHDITLLPSGGFAAEFELGKLRIWSKTGELITTHEGHSHPISIAVLNNGDIVTGFDGDTARLCKKTGDVTLVQGHTDSITCVSALPNGGFVTGSDDGTLRFWSETGEFIVETCRIRGITNCIAVLKSGGIAAVFGFGASVCVFEANGKLIAIKTYVDPSIKTYVDPSIHLIIALKNGGFATAGNSVMVWSAIGELIATLQGPTKVTCITTLPHGVIAAGFEDGTVYLWSEAGEPIAILNGHTGPVSCISAWENGILTGSSVINAHYFGREQDVRFWQIDGRALTAIRRKRPLV